MAVLDGSIKDFKTISAEIQRFQPDLLGLNVMTFLWDKVKAWAAKLKEDMPGMFVVVGGAHPTQIKEKCLSECAAIDAVVLGEAEYVFLDVANKVGQKKPLDGTPGLIFRGSDGRIKSGGPNPRIEDLDKIPFPARDLINIYDYVPALEQYKRLPVTNMITTRGCPYKCIFCSSGNTKAYFRSPQNILEEIKLLVDTYKIKDITFWDDTFTLNKFRVLEIMSLIKKEKFDLIFSVNSRVNLLDRDLVREMSSAGCWKIFFGVESMLQKNLDVLRKGIQVEQIFNAVGLCKEFKIESECSFIFGTPGETYREGIATIKLIKKLDPDYVKFFPLTPLPGTELDRIAAETGSMVTEDLDKRTENQVVYTPHTMTAEDMQRLIKLAYKSFYFRPAYMVRRVLKMRTATDVRKAWRGMRAVSSL